MNKQSDLTLTEKSFKLSRTYWVVLIAIVVVSLFIFASCVYPIYVHLFMGLPGKADFRKRKESLQRMVDHLSSLDLPKNELSVFNCDKDFSLDSFRPQVDYSIPTNTHYSVGAMRHEDGRLLIEVVTKMVFRARHGYVFSSDGLQQPDELGPDSWGGTETSINVGLIGEWWVDEEIVPDHWWAVHNALD